MKPHVREEERQLFRKILFEMRDKGYIEPDIANGVGKAHLQYHLDLLEQDRERSEALAERAKLASNPPAQHIQKPGVQPAAEKNVPEAVRPAPKPYVPKPKNVLTAEQIRERNISWLLNIGVIFLLIGGLFVATSNWESMSSIMKSMTIALVSFVFFGFAYLSAKILKIKKTAFAFLVLGNLFLPIFVLSLGWFGLLGPYLSVGGEGGFLLGFLGSLLPSVVYILFAKKLGSRLFVWFSYIGISFAAGFLLASMKLGIDYFYLGIMLYNALVIFVYFKYRKHGALELFVKEFPVYIQANLILSTLLMLFFYNSEVVYSFNLILTAAIYLSMMYVSNKKEYHFIFSAMLVYGAYQLIEHSFLQSADAIFYALLALGFVFIPKGLQGSFLLDRAFRYTSAAVSILAFLYITIEGFLIRAGEPSIVLFIAYLIIAGNFLLLTRIEKQPLFPYLSTAFLGSAFYEAAQLFSKYIIEFSFQTAIFAAGLLLFVLIGWLGRKQPVESLRSPARELGLGGMLLSIIISQGFQEWFELGIMLLIFSGTILAMRKLDSRIQLKTVAAWAAPISFGFSVLAFWHSAGIKNSFIHTELGFPVYFASAAGILLVLAFLVWKNRDNELEQSFFYTGQGMYTAAILLLIGGGSDPVWVQPLVMIGAIVCYWILYKRHQLQWTSVLLGTVVFGFYFAAVSSLDELLEFSHEVYSLITPGGAAFMLLLALGLKHKDRLLYWGFAWLGHITLPAALAFSWAIDPDWSLYSFLAAIGIYASSSRLAISLLKKIVFMYAAFTTLFVSVSKVFDLFRDGYAGSYEFPATSLLLVIVWFLLKGKLQESAAYYIVGFSMVGLAFMSFTYPFTLLPFAVTLLYGLGTLLFLHKIRWDVLAFLPLLFIFFAAMEYTAASALGDTMIFLFAGAAGLVHVAFGKFLYPRLYRGGKGIKETQFDSYTVVSFLYFVYMYSFAELSIWMAPIPGLLIALTVWLQRNRVDKSIGFFIPAAAGIILLQPYYGLLGELTIPALFEREVQVLPVIALAIFLRKAMKGRYRNITSNLQWAALLFSAILLIQDGLASSTVYDALILGTLSLVSLLAGMFLRIKSYFFTGAGVLLLNVFLQTRPYWGNLPWWGYLLAAGTLLIGIASYNEWNKQRGDTGGEPLGARLKQRIRNTLNGWN
ncbi:hypothetical protein A8F94_01760 [Bacillus sp. FJAT-27225]|uniref:hypothetical protein n=1 Tax=Bacillus sp. FJAT-27225 TaxID=1743144 RepID=UPI00080C280B|nr:hypothetical protein [Bacillus sp. FJAT-27225]OCA90630.1 hypothetical protein A8F94_01760 [Bacillus sp. FJAT-27225]